MKMLHLKLGSQQFAKIPTPKISKFLKSSPYWMWGTTYKNSRIFKKLALLGAEDHVFIIKFNYF